MRTIIAMALVLAAGVANAAPVTLSCSGTIYTLEHERERPEKTHPIVYKALRTLTVDLSAKTVMLEDEKPTPIEQMDQKWVRFGVEDVSPLVRGLLLVRGGLQSGRLNRISGNVILEIVTQGGDGLDIFEGVCKPAQKLF
jgi:hypothetical protein